MYLHDNRELFSEDIDITFSNTLTQGQRKKLKNDVIAGIRDELGLPIMDWENIRSRRDYNCYVYQFLSNENMDIVEEKGRGN